MRQMRIQLGVEVASRKRVYLDQRFWILLRDASLGICHDRETVELLEFLKDSVNNGKLICPISESVFIELLKQEDKATRIATAQLIDELSQGVTLIPFNDRVRQELCNSFYENAGASELIPIGELVWTKLSYVLGEMHPTHTQFDPEDELAIQKAFADYLWEMPLYQTVMRMEEKLSLRVDWEAIAIQLNSTNLIQRSTLRSYAQTFRIEFEGGLSLFREEIKYLANEISKHGYEVGSKLAHLSQKKRFETFALSVPTLHINASCHTAVRWDQTRKLTGNDLFDFHHAGGALAYCNAFLTEKPLCDMLSQHHLGLIRYGCQILWSPSAALNWMREN
ncbi:hypothetical protein [Fluviibacter sp.]